VKRKSPDIQQIEYSLRCALESEKNVATAYIFGSLGTPYFNADSDIDIGLLFYPDRVPDVLEVLAIQEKLSTAARSEVDVVFLNQSSPVICMQVLRNGRKVIERDPRVTNDFFVRTVNLYLDLKRVRLPIEENILSGRLYSD